MLRVSKVPPGDPTTEEYVGQNRFECLTCPYHFVINKRYFERKYMKKKEVEDILGGKGAWDNVDKTQGMSFTTLQSLAKSWNVVFGPGIIANERTVQCPNEKCRNDEAYWYQLQIRSADEPMTAFYKVGYILENEKCPLIILSAPNVRKNGANKLGRSTLHTAFKEFGTIGNIPIFFPRFCSFCLSIICPFAFVRGYEQPEHSSEGLTVVLRGL
jgi:DNA-directed RNA polymerase III subunit RPC11